MQEITLKAIEKVFDSKFDKKIDTKLEILKKVLHQQTLLFAEIVKNLDRDSLPH